MGKIEISSESVKTFLLNLVVRTICSIAVSLLITFVLVLIYGFVVIPEESLLQGLLNVIPLTFPPFFIMSFSLLFASYAISVVNQWQEPKFYNKARKRLHRINFETRHLLEYGFKWTGACLFLIMWVDFVMMVREMILHSLVPLLFPESWLFVALYFASFISFALSRLLMNHFDWAILYLKRFRKHKVSNDLDKAFANYNRLLGSTLSMKKMLSISQFVNEAYKISKDNDLKSINEGIDDLIKSLKKQEISAANEKLLTLSESAMKIVQKHQEILGFEVRYPLRYRIADVLRSRVVSEVFIHLAWFSMWLAILIVLTLTGLLPQFPPSPPS